jgi:Zn-dependent M16 (insulinase) family peptidase
LAFPSAHVSTGAALNVALLYLAGSSVSVLENTLVEKEQLASAVYYTTDDRPKTEIAFTLTSVATEKLAEVESRFFEVLRDAMKEKLDMAYMVDCVRRSVRTWKFATERSTSTFTQYAITDFLYGKRDGSTLKDVAALKEYDDLEHWTEDQWKHFIKKWISNMYQSWVCHQRNFQRSSR